MPGIFMICPTTKLEVSTSRHVTAFALQAALRAGGSFRCPSCNMIHDWTEADAIVGDTKAHLRSDTSQSSRKA